MTTAAPAALSTGAEEGISLPAPSRSTLAELYDRFGPTAYALAFAITNDRLTSERVVTDAFALAWRQYERDRESALLGAGAFFATLITQVRAGSVRLRRPGANRPFFAPPAAEPAPSTGNALARALRELPDNERLVLALAYFGGLDVAAIAAELRQPPSHVKASLTAALARLRSLLPVPTRGAMPL